MGLFGFRKGRAGAPAAVKPREMAPADAGELLARADGLRARLGGTEGEGRAAMLNDLGRALADAGDLDGAIAAYEESLGLKRVMGAASAALVKLYNKKRAQAAAKGDDEAIVLYMDKVNGLLALSKDQIRGRA